MPLFGSQVHQRQQLLGLLEQYYGYSSFREPQEEVILNALGGNDSLVVMATGAGKSICYQMPPLLTGRPCIVVSPLIALMEDQVAALTARGIKAAFLGSAQMSAEVKRRAWSGEYQLIYITPELATNNTSQLQQLHSTHPIGLIAIDEAHCVSEWGHDFRPCYRQLGVLRQALPGVPIMAVTATATERVQRDILGQLGMGKPGQPLVRQWVMSFQRTNLHLAVSLKAGSSVGQTLAGLIQAAQEAQAKGQKLDPTLIYAQTTKEVDELAAYLQGKGISAVKYHAKLPVRQRNEAHYAFQHDDAEVMVASLAFGMGIDKPNIRKIIHYGIPSSLESYYQQAGRAGRDGVPSQCTLMWAPQDFMVQDLIKGAGNLSGWNLDSHQRGMASLRAYVSSGDCRHAALVNFFQPGKLPVQGPCVGGCDNCDRRKAASTAAAASGGQAAGDMKPGETDVTHPARLLVATTKALKQHYGMNKAIAVLRGSKAKSVEPWMMAVKADDGTALHGAGNNWSEDWWKGFANVMLGQGYLTSQTRTNQYSGASFSIVQLTRQGYDLLAGRPQRVCLMLPAHLDAEENKRRQKEEAERQRAEAREAAQKARDEEDSEKQQLLAQLKQRRKEVADTLGQAANVLVNDFTLNQLVELRPADHEQLQFVSGFGQAALQHYAQPLLDVIKQFCTTSKHLKHGNEGQWNVLRRHRAAQRQLQAQQQTQAPSLWQGTNQQASASLADFAFQGAGQAAGFCPPPQGSGCGASGNTTEDYGNTNGASTQLPTFQGTPANGMHATPAAATGALYVDQDMYRSMQDCKILNEAKVAAQAAWERWLSGSTAEQVATMREKAIQVSTVLGYLAEAAADAGATPAGCAPQYVQRLQQEAGLVGAAAEVQLWRIAAALQSNRNAGISSVKNALPKEDAYGYGQIKVVAALMVLQVLPGPAQFEEQELIQQPVQQVQRCPAVDKVLPLPSNSAQKLYAMWRLGVPLDAVGDMHGTKMQPQAVLSALAEMAGSGYPADMQQLVAAAQLQETTARSIAAAITSQGHLGIHVVKQSLDAQGVGVGYGQIKVVAALMATRELWFFDSIHASGAAEDADSIFNAAPQSASAVNAAGMTQQAPQQALHSPSHLVASASNPPPQEVQQQQQIGGSSAQPSAPRAAVVAGTTQKGSTAGTPGCADAGAGGDSDEAAPAPAAGAAVKRARPAFLLSNKTGKRRKPNSIAPPAPAAAVAVHAVPAQQQQQQQQPQSAPGFATPVPQPANGAASGSAAQSTAVPGTAAATPSAAAQATPAGITTITQQAVLHALWNGAATAPQLLKKLGVSGRDQEQQLQQVLEALVEDGEHVCITPEGRGVNLQDECVRFIAF